MVQQLSSPKKPVSFFGFEKMKLSSSVFPRQNLNSAKAGQITWLWQDFLGVGILAIIAGLASYGFAQSIDPYLLENPSWAVWFESDLPRSFANMIARSSNHYRTSVDPLFSLIAFPPAYILYQLGGDAVTAVRIVIAIVASVWISTVFLLLRLLGCRQLDAILFSLLGSISAAAIFWFAVPETFLYSLHFAPFLVIVAAMSTMTRARLLALVLAGLLLVCAGMNNVSEFNQATKILRERARQQIVLPAASKNREEARYHRFGGSFRPPNSSFGISFGIIDRQGKLQTTSDNLPLSDISQQLVKDDNQDLSGIETTTDYYQAFWKQSHSREENKNENA